MSNTAINAVKWCSKSKGGARLMLILIADGVSKDSGVYDAKIETLMAEANYNRRFVQRLINKLIKDGELIVYDRTNRPNAFMIPILEGEPGADAKQECPGGDHSCNGKHSPLNLNREELHRATFGPKGAMRRKSQRSIGRPADNETSQGGLLAAPQRSIDRPTAVYGPPQSGLLTAQYPLSTPLSTRDVPDARPQNKKNASTAEPDSQVPPPWTSNLWQRFRSDPQTRLWLRQHGYDPDSYKTSDNMRAYAEWCAEQEENPA